MQPTTRVYEGGYACHRHAHTHYIAPTHGPKTQSLSMSVRTTVPKNRAPRNASALMPVAPTLAPPVATESPTSAKEANVLNMDDLTPREQAVARLGVDPNSLVGISWLNDAHHAQLVKDNALSPTFARQLEAYKQETAA